jgi:divalent metal cation (Fe/Co/Zn/Cd) transporter
MEAVEPELTDLVTRVVAERPNVQTVDQLRLRYVGHQLHGDVRLKVSDPPQAAVTVADIRHQLGHDVPQLADLVIETS